MTAKGAAKIAPASATPAIRGGPPFSSTMPVAGIPGPDEVRQAIDKIAGSEIFLSSPQLVAFLRFVTEAALQGRSDRIKGYTIGVEVLKRGSQFNPQVDPIVRVEATRLRRAMDRYYNGPGIGDPVRISIARGSYVPSFSYRTASGAPEVDHASPSAGGFQPGNGMPTLLVHPFAVLCETAESTASALTLHEKLCDAFARFDTINIVSGADDALHAPVLETGQNVNYRLMGSVEYRDDGTTNVRFRLIDTADNTVLWSRVFERLATAGGRAAAEDAVVTELAQTLVQPFGVIRAHERVKHLAGREADPRYRSIVEASESFRSFDPKQHVLARVSLEHLVAVDPGFASGFAYLAAVYFREFQFGMAGQLGDPAMLDRALEMARRAIELKPENSRAYQILFGVLFARHEIAAAFAAGDRAIALNKYDMTVLSDYGGRLVIIGDVERGMDMLQRAGEFGTVRPSWHHFYMFLGSYLRGDLTNTVHHATQITAEDYPLGLMAQALAAAVAGDRDRARNSIEKLMTVNPAWRTDPRRELDKFFPAAELADRLARDLARIGLPVNI